MKWLSLLLVSVAFLNVPAIAFEHFAQDPAEQEGQGEPRAAKPIDQEAYFKLEKAVEKRVEELLDYIEKKGFKLTPSIAPKVKVLRLFLQALTREQWFETRLTLADKSVYLTTVDYLRELVLESFLMEGGEKQAVKEMGPRYAHQEKSFRDSWLVKDAKDPRLTKMGRDAVAWREGLLAARQSAYDGFTTSWLKQFETPKQREGRLGKVWKDFKSGSPERKRKFDIAKAEIERLTKLAEAELKKVKPGEIADDAAKKLKQLASDIEREKAALDDDLRLIGEDLDALGIEIQREGSRLGDSIERESTQIGKELDSLVKDIDSEIRKIEEDLRKSGLPEKVERIKHDVEKAANNIGKAAEEAGKKLEELGKDIEKKLKGIKFPR